MSAVFDNWVAMKAWNSTRVVHLGSPDRLEIYSNVDEFIGVSKCGWFMRVEVPGGLEAVTCRGCLRQLRAHGVKV